MKHTRILSIILVVVSVAMLTGCSLIEDNTPITPTLTEDEILNMTDEDFWNYADLADRGFLLSVDTPNPIRNEFGISREAGYRYVGRFASTSASDVEEALDIAAAKWEKQGEGFKNIKLIGENDKFWLFQSDYYYNEEWCHFDTLIVFKKDYYDAGTNTVKFELNNTNIRNFFAYCSPEQISTGIICLGEYMIDDGEGFTIRRYYIKVSHGDYGMYDRAVMNAVAGHISADGKVQSMFEYSVFSRESNIPFRPN